VALAYVVAAVILFVYFNVWIKVVYALMLIFLTYFFVTLYNQLSVTIERSKLLKLATRDSLTGLFNIGHFKLLFKAEMSTLPLRRNKTLSLLMGDVDNFKRTNDVYGHLTGDEVLKEVANVMKSNCRALDVVGRYGGEEFIVMLPGANSDEAFRVAEKIRKGVESKVFFHPKGDFTTSISIGLTEVGPQDKDMNHVIARADKALYEAKAAGKNKAVIASDTPKMPRPDAQNPA
jgi:diguanylate cyclase (GGDEF)-like protein